MNQYVRTLTAAAVIIFAASQIQAQNEKHVVDQIGWLAGCWEMKNDAKGLVITEQWMKPAGGTMFGTGRTVKNGQTVDFEFTRFEQQETGIYYIARPKENKDDTAFKLIKFAAGEVVLENPVHDYP